MYIVPKIVVFPLNIHSGDGVQRDPPALFVAQTGQQWFYLESDTLHFLCFLPTAPAAQ